MRSALDPVLVGEQKRQVEPIGGAGGGIYPLGPLCTGSVLSPCECTVQIIPGANNYTIGCLVSENRLSGEWE